MRHRSLALALVAGASLLSLLAPRLSGQERSPRDQVRALEPVLTALAERSTPRTAIVYGAIGLGSGAVVDKQGTVVTNAHVALASRFAILEFADGRRVLARRRGIDFERDLAVLEPETPLAAPVPCFELGHEKPAVGSWVVALGYPGGPRGDLRPTVSLGQVIPGGGLETSVMGVLRYDDSIRTDVTIFSGNSGGPLLDLEGRLVGINGAINVGELAAFALPVELVRDRLRTLQGGVIRLPGGRTIDESNPIVAQLGRVVDPIVKQMIERVREGFSPDPEGGAAGKILGRIAGGGAGAAGKGRWSAEADELAKRVRTSARSKALAQAFEGPAAKASGLAVRLEGGRVATRLSRRHAVTKASLLGGDRESVKLDGGKTARVVATAPENDLALLELPEEADVALAPDAGARPAGSLVAAFGPGGLLAAGIVSVGPRPIPAAVSQRISGGGGTQEKLLETLKKLTELADNLGSKALGDLLRGISGQMEAQHALTAGSEPRGYESVLSHDAGLSPAEGGAPLVDDDGRLVGVNVSSANYGTSYAVPILAVRRAFAAQLGGDGLPALEQGKARLH